MISAFVSRCGRVELDVAPGVRDRLERDRADGRVRHAEADDVTDLVLVEALLDGGDEGDGQAELGAVVEGLLLRVAQVAPTDVEVRPLVEAVELHVDVRPA